MEERVDRGESGWGRGWVGERVDRERVDGGEGGWRRGWMGERVDGG